jgi:Domain of unknown function (DUF1330)
MAAYIVFTHHSTWDPKESKRTRKWRRHSDRSPGQHARCLWPSRNGRGSGDRRHGHSRISDHRTAKAWYNSPAYREAREHRFKGAEYRVVIVQGMTGA